MGVLTTLPNLRSATDEDILRARETAKTMREEAKDIEWWVEKVYEARQWKGYQDTVGSYLDAAISFRVGSLVEMDAWRVLCVARDKALRQKHDQIPAGEAP